MFCCCICCCWNPEKFQPENWGKIHHYGGDLFQPQLMGFDRCLSLKLKLHPGKLTAGTWKSPVWKGNSFDPKLHFLVLRKFSVVYIDSIQVDKFLELTEFTYTFTQMKQTKWENHKWRGKKKQDAENLGILKSNQKQQVFTEIVAWGVSWVLTWQIFGHFGISGGFVLMCSGAWVFILAAVLLLLAISAAAFYAYKKRSV